MRQKQTDKEKENTPLQKKLEEHFISNRSVFLWGGVDDESSERIVKYLLFLDQQNHDDIKFFINSPGGVITAGMAIYDVMQAIKSDVITIVTGQAASMGSVLLCAGTPKKRFAWPNARVMIHQPLISGQIYGPASDLEIQAEEMLRVRSSLNQILAKHSGKKAQQIEKDTERDNFMTAKEAINYNLIDTIKTVL